MISLKVLVSSNSCMIDERMFFSSADGPSWAWIMLNLLPIEHDLQYTILTSRSIRTRLQIINDTINFLMSHRLRHQQRQQQQEQRQEEQHMEHQQEREQESTPSSDTWLFSHDHHAQSLLLLILSQCLSNKSIKYGWENKRKRTSCLIFVIYQQCDVFSIER